MTALNRNEIFKNVQACVAESLALAVEQVTLESSLIDQLGADSLDLLEIIFTLERKFSIPLKKAELEKLTRGELKSESLIDGKYLPPEEIEQLESWLPALKKLADKNSIQPRQLFSFITVESLVILIEKESVAQQS